jgi:hypothetical protein
MVRLAAPLTAGGGVQADLKQKEAQANLVYPYSASYNKTRISDILQAADGGRSLVSSSATVACS